MSFKRESKPRLRDMFFLRKFTPMRDRSIQKHTTPSPLLTRRTRGFRLNLINKSSINLRQKSFQTKLPPMHSVRVLQYTKARELQKPPSVTDLPAQEPETAFVFKEQDEFGPLHLLNFLLDGKSWESVNQYVEYRLPFYNSYEWNLVKLSVYRKAYLGKLQTHPRIKDNLKYTYPKEIIFFNEHDRFWGAGFNGMGENRLGKLLKEIRDTFI